MGSETMRGTILKKLPFKKFVVSELSEYDLAGYKEMRIHFLERLSERYEIIISEEEYDTVRGVTQALNNSRPSQDQVEDYLGRSLSSSELRAFGFNSRTVIGYKHGQPQYAGQGQRKTYTSYARGNSRRSY